jgi:predicted transcriptional regulator
MRRPAPPLVVSLSNHERSRHRNSETECPILKAKTCLPVVRIGVTKVLLEPVMANVPTSLKLPRKLRTRVARVAKRTGRTPHRVMLEAIERETAREERLEAFVKEALAADRAVDRTGEVYAARDVHGWLLRLASGKKTGRPRPWRR